MGNSTKLVRLVIGASATALYLGLLAWAYTAAVADDMATMIGALLAAWIIAAAALVFSESSGSISAKKRLATNFVGVTIIGFVTILFGVYFNTRRPRTPITEGALLEIDALQPTRLADGGYILPITIKNVGKSEIGGYAGDFGETFSERILTPSEENVFMGPVERSVRGQIKALDGNFVSPGALLVPGASGTMWEPNFKISEQQVQLIWSGKLIPYYGVAAAYIDGKDGTLRFTERCFYYDASTKHYLNCAGHNFVKGDSLPTNPPDVYLPIPAPLSTQKEK